MTTLPLFFTFVHLSVYRFIAVTTVTTVVTILCCSTFFVFVLHLHIFDTFIPCYTYRRTRGLYRDKLVVRHCLCTITVITIFIHVLRNSELCLTYLTIIFPRRQPPIALKSNIQSPGLRESFMSSAFWASRTSSCSRSHCLTVPLRHPA